MIQSQKPQLDSYRVELQEPKRIFSKTFYMKEDVDKLLQEKYNQILKLQKQIQDNDTESTCPLLKLPKPKKVEIDYGLGAISTEVYEAKDVSKMLRVLKALQAENESLRRLQGGSIFEVIDSRISELQEENKKLKEENKMLKKVTEAR